MLLYPNVVVCYGSVELSPKVLLRRNVRRLLVMSLVKLGLLKSRERLLSEVKSEVSLVQIRGVFKKRVF